MRPVLLLLALFAMIVALPGKPGGMLAARPGPPIKRIALSFDDAPRSRGAFFTEDERAERLIESLRAEQADQVVFFVNSGRINLGDGDEARLARYVASGHLIANHTAEHTILSRGSVERFLADVDQGEKWLSGRAGYRPWLRFPGLDEGGTDIAKRDAVRAALAARHLRDAYVTVDGLDWNMEANSMAAMRRGQPMDMDALRTLYVETHVQAADFADALARRATGRSPVHMLLLHETDMAALYIGDLIEALRADGWEVVTADEAYADPIYSHTPDTPHANGTLIEQLAWEKGVTGPRWYDRDDVHVANRLFAERVLHEK